MELDRYYELRAILQQWRTRLAESIRRRIENSDRWLNRLHRMHQADGTGEEFTLWLDRWCRQAAIQFILRLLFLRVLEDRDLLGVTRLRTTDGQQMWAQLTRNLGAASYVQWCCWDAAHLLPDLFGPTEYDLVLPDDELVQRFLDDVWRRPDPDRGGDWLRFDFRPDPEHQDEGFRTRFIGDLYQELDAEIRERYALLQTPHFVAQFILEHTLLKRFEEKDFHEITLIDPTCGSGHFLVDAFWHFVARYEAEALGRGDAFSLAPLSPRSPAPEYALPSAARARIARTIIETHLHGCDINPYATALTRFRLILAACDYAQPTSLADFRDLHFNVVTIDSLIPYEKLIVSGVQADTAVAELYGQPEAIKKATPILLKHYEVVVGNPPYIVPEDAVKRRLYRQYYPNSALGKYGLSAPFIERFILLGAEEGLIGLISSNAFALRSFGKGVIEKVLPKYQLETLVDTSGAYIPGHGTPTLILIVRQRFPSSSSVTVLSNLKGEQGIPANPDLGSVWLAIKRGMMTGSEYQDEYIEVSQVPRETLAHHPWRFGGPYERLFNQINRKNSIRLENLVEYLGPGIATNYDEIYPTSADFARRLGVKQKYLKPYVRGVDIRNWSISIDSEYVFFPYTIDNKELVVSELEDDQKLFTYFRKFKSDLEIRPALPASYKWYEYTRKAGASFIDHLVLVYAQITSFNQMALVSAPNVYQRSACPIQLSNFDETIYAILAGLMGSSTGCLLWKQRCFNKGAGDDPIRDRYDFAPNRLSQIPLPNTFHDVSKNNRLLTLVQEIISLASQISGLSNKKLFESPGEAYHAWNSTLDGYTLPHPRMPTSFSTARELRVARDKLVALRQDIHGRMIFLQEEMDWLTYEMYGLLKGKAPLAEDFLSRREYEAARLELGQRPFEIAGKGYQGDWPQGYQPAPLPEVLRPLTEERMAVIKANPDIALLEDPLYKRRWVPPDYDQEFRAAAAWWLAEKLEYALEKAGRPLSLREWVKILSRDERVNAALEVLTGSPLPDLENELLKIIRANAVPNRPEHYLKLSGLRKLYAGRSAARIPEFSSEDFGDSTAWKQRGKLNIPRERFIHYAEFDPNGRGVDIPESGGPWFGWAGWEAAQRADALAYLLDQANRAGWEIHYRQCGLRAALRDLLPDLSDIPAADRAEFEAIAGLCGLSLATPCYCPAYHDGLKQEQPGVPGVTAEMLGVKVLPAEGKRSAGTQKKSEDSGQMKMDL